MLYALAIGFFQQAINPYSRPVLTMTVGLFLTAFFFLLIPLLISAFSLQAFSILCVLMSLDGYFQSYVWPNLLMVVNSYFDNKKDAILLGVWSTNTNFGNIFGFIMGEVIVIRAGLQWEVGMYFISFFMIVIGLLTYFGLQELPK
jgi:sugar phosphate permease